MDMSQIIIFGRSIIFCPLEKPHKPVSANTLIFSLTTFEANIGGIIGHGNSTICYMYDQISKKWAINMTAQGKEVNENETPGGLPILHYDKEIPKGL